MIDAPVTEPVHASHAPVKSVLDEPTAVLHPPAALRPLRRADPGRVRPLHEKRVDEPAHQPPGEAEGPDPRERLDVDDACVPHAQHLSAPLPISV